MTIQLPQASDPLNLPDHAFSHRVFAVDDKSPEQSVVIDSAGVASVIMGVKTPLIFPDVDSTIAIQIVKADGVTPLMTFDTENVQITVGKAGISSGNSLVPFSIAGSDTSYIAFSIQNLNDGASSYTDIFCSADNDGQGLIGHYVDMGIASSGFSAVAEGSVKTFSRAAGGSGYSIGDILTIVGGDNNFQVRVATLAGSSVDTIEIVLNGTGYSVGNGLATTYGGAGTNCTINILTLQDNTLYEANDCYLYGGGGNLLLSTDDSVAGKVVKIATGGSGIGNLRVTISNTGMAVIGNISFTGSLSKIGGTASQFLKANGSIDSSTYLTSLSGALLSTGATTGASSQAQTFTVGVIGKNIPRVDSQTTTTTITPETSTYSSFIRTAQATGITINNHSTTTPVDREEFEISLTCDATPRAVAVGTDYVTKSVPIPTILIANKNTTMRFKWYAELTKYCMISCTQE